MTKYVKGKDGKFKGSIGDGKTNLPTVSQRPQNAQRKCDNCGAQTHDWALRRWDSGDVETYCAACSAAEDAFANQNAAWDRFQKRQAITDTEPDAWLATPEDFIEGTASTEHGEAYYMDTREYATRVLPLESETGAIEWEATTAFADRQFDDRGFPTGSIESVFLEKTFSSKDEAEQWAEEQAHRIHSERLSFQEQYKADPNFMDESPFRIPDFEEESDIPSGMVTMNIGDLSAKVNFGSDPAIASITKAGEPYHFLEAEDPLEALHFSRYILTSGK